MGTNGNVMSISQPSIPVLKGDNYEFWSFKMKTLFQSQELLHLVKDGYTKKNIDDRLRENKKKVSKRYSSFNKQLMSRYSPKLQL